MSQHEIQVDIEPREGQQEEASQEDVREPADEAVQSAAEVAEPGERLVPVSEAKRYRKRAQAAEATLEEVKAQLAQNEEQIRRSEAMIEALERRLAVDEALVEHEAVDLEAARLLVEQAMAEDASADASAIVAELKRRKPLLFHTRSRSAPAVAQAAREANGHPHPREQLVRAASDASVTGHRHDVLRYLRLRRSSKH